MPLPRSSSSALWMASTSPSSRTPVTEETIIDHWGPGVHALEVRSADNLTVWARGELELTAGQSVVISLEAGRPLDVQGNAGVWRSGGRER